MTGELMARARSLTEFQAWPSVSSVAPDRRFYRHVSFETMLGLAAHHEPASYWDVIGRANPRKGNVTLRRVPRRRKTATGMRRDGSVKVQIQRQNQASNPRGS
jgi:hypothetical protein